MTARLPVHFRERQDGSRQIVLSQSHYRLWDDELASEIWRQSAALASANDRGDELSAHTAMTLLNHNVALQNSLRFVWSPEAAEKSRMTRGRWGDYVLGQSEAGGGVEGARSAPGPAPAFTKPVTRKVSPENRKTGAQGD